MLQLVLAFIAGMIVMDIMWAVKLGIPQAMYYNWKLRKVLNQMSQEEQS